MTTSWRNCGVRRVWRRRRSEFAGMAPSLAATLALLVVMSSPVPSAAPMPAEDQAGSGDVVAATTELTIEVMSARGDTLVPVPGAGVTVTSAAGDTTEKTTDAAGKVVFASLPRGPARLAVSDEHLEPADRVVDLTLDRQSVRFTLAPRQGRLRITIIGVDEGSEIPVAGCKVGVKTEEGQTHSLPSTDEEGVVVSPDLPFGRVTVTAIATGWETAVTTFTLETPQGELKIRLQKQIPPGGGGI